MPTYSIKDLQHLSGVKAHTIRIWEQRYSLLSPQRTITNIRRYSDNDLRKLLSVAMLNSNGLKISKISNLTDEELATSVMKLTQGADAKSESQIERLKMIMLEMNESKFEKLFSHLLLQMGFEDTILSVFTPFFKQLTFLWQTNSVMISQINFITALYRQKIAVATDGLPTIDEKSGAKKLILFLPKKETLDNGLLFCNYMARKRGYQTLYLGNSFPVEELPEILAKNPDSNIISVATLAQTDLTQYYVRVLAACGANQKVFIAGSQAQTVKISDPRLTICQDYGELRTLLEQK